MDEKTQAVINLQQLFAGFTGAIIMVLKTKDKRNLYTNVASVIAGTASATYLTPILGKAFNQTDPNYLLGFAFLLGALGLRSIEVFADYMGLDGKRGLNKPIVIDITKD